MKIDKLEILNFKNYETASLNFDRGVNLFVGSNGSGKTALLDAINVALGGFFGEQESKMQRMIELSEVRIRLTNGNPIRAEKTTIQASSADIGGTWSRNFNSLTRNNDSKESRLASSFGSKVLNSFLDPENKEIAPFIAYYSTQRMFKYVSQS